VSSPRRFGLPETLRMRHDTHYVDQLGRVGGAPIGRLIPIEDIDPNPNQPRQSVGDLSELVASVREKGVLEPILVRPSGSRFEIIAGERRYRAAMEVGLAEMPCVVRDASDAETMEIALIENLQRKDLHAFEEADGLKVLAESYGYTHEKMAQKLGKSRTSVTEVLSLTNMPDDVRELCRLADIHSKSLLLQVVRQSSPEKMVELIGRLQAEGLTTRQQMRTALKPVQKPARGRPRNFVFKYQPKEKTFSLALQFKRSEVPREEVVRALQSIIEDLMREDA
jgi:ParB family transcriptional regulator, chromosome partitioning protein